MMVSLIERPKPSVGMSNPDGGGKKKGAKEARNIMKNAQKRFHFRMDPGISAPASQAVANRVVQGVFYSKGRHRGRSTAGFRGKGKISNTRPELFYGIILMKNSYNNTFVLKFSISSFEFLLKGNFQQKKQSLVALLIELLVVVAYRYTESVDLPRNATKAREQVKETGSSNNLKQIGRGIVSIRMNYEVSCMNALTSALIVENWHHDNLHFLAYHHPALREASQLYTIRR